ncbi:MAG: LytR C-terminal domain-containing protein [Candidatus Eisenbacteria bacterium]|nr:LytR C-terminal domain-containing protein [Candidatus Eisenbacteria bacterium]
MARKSSRKRRVPKGGSAWPAVVLLVLAVGLVAAFAGSAAIKAVGGLRARWAGSVAEAGRESAPRAMRAQRQAVRIEILNGSGNAGAGGRVAEALRDGGFRVTRVENADRQDYGTTLVLDRKGDPAAAREVVEYLHGGFPLLMRTALASADIRVVVGRDYRGLRLTP